jgi:hypothetical protein
MVLAFGLATIIVWSDRPRDPARQQSIDIAEVSTRFT